MLGRNHWNRRGGTADSLTTTDAGESRTTGSFKLSLNGASTCICRLLLQAIGKRTSRRSLRQTASGCLLKGRAKTLGPAHGDYRRRLSRRRLRRRARKHGRGCRRTTINCRS